MLKLILLLYIIGSGVSLYFYILGDRCAHFKKYRYHKIYNDLDSFLVAIVLIFWPFVVPDFFKDKDTFHFTWKIFYYTPNKAEKYL